MGLSEHDLRCHAQTDSSQSPVSGGNSQEMQYEQMETSDTGIDFAQPFTEMEPVIATVLGDTKQ